LTLIHANAPTKRVREMVEILRRADAEGLNPEVYDGPRWVERFAQLESSHSPEGEARFDVALTVCAMRYISDVRIGRINPEHFQFGPGLSNARNSICRASCGNSFPSRLASKHGGQHRASVRAIQGDSPSFAQVYGVGERRRWRKVARVTGHPVRRRSYEGISRLASRLRLIADLPRDAVIPADSKVYVGPLVDAVKRFQERHGLTPNGYLTVDTVEQLNVPLRAGPAKRQEFSRSP
jgi:murein L,D-transpeptidase YcbB/YkuD